MNTDKIDFKASILKCAWKIDDKGKTYLHQTLLTYTPAEEFDRINADFTLWRGVKQVKYGKDGGLL
jgi:hypothetical protein